MPNTTARLRALLAVAALTALPVLGITQATAAAPRLLDDPTPEPPCTVLCQTVPPSPTPSQAPAPTAPPAATSAPPAPSPSAPTTTATVRPTPQRTSSQVTSTPRTSSPRPQATAEPLGSTASPVTGAFDVGRLTDGGTPSAAAVQGQPAAARADAGGSLGSLLKVVIVLAVLLGTGGAAGLYLTRHHPHG